MNTPSEILRKHEDANEMHLHKVDKKWVIQAMEEYAEQQVKATVKYYNGEPMEEYAKEKSEKPINLTSSQTEISDEEIEEASPYVPNDASMDYWAHKEGFIDGAKWYREQLKKK